MPFNRRKGISISRIGWGGQGGVIRSRLGWGGVSTSQEGGAVGGALGGIGVGAGRVG